MSAYKAFKHGNYNMDVLVVLGTTSAWGYGIILMFYGYAYDCQTMSNEDAKVFMKQVMDNTHNFETSSTLVTVIIFGKFLEALSK